MDAHKTIQSVFHILGILVILGFLFFIQSRGTARVATFFGPMMTIYFGTISVLGIVSIAASPIDAA